MLAIRTKRQISFSKRLKLERLFLPLILMWGTSGYAQEDSSYFFEGRVLDENSVPVGNVYVINYRNLKFCSTDNNGYFSASVIPGDSLMTYHIAHEPLVIKACISDTVPSYLLAYKIYELFESNVSVVVKKTSVYEEILLDNFNENWDRMLDHMQKELSYKPQREIPEHPHDSIFNGDNSSIINGLNMSGGGGFSTALDLEAICKKLSKNKRN